MLGRFESAIGRHVPVERWARPDAEAAPRSLAWLLFHTTYHQDLALNTAIRNHEPLLVAHRNVLGLGDLPPAAGLTEAEDRDVTEALDLRSSQVYVEAVQPPHRAVDREAQRDGTRFGPVEQLPARAQRRHPGRTATWIGCTRCGTASRSAGCVQWECIGHGHAHVGEMVGVRNRLGLSPF